MISQLFRSKWDKHIADKWMENIQAVINGDYDVDKMTTHATTMGMFPDELKSIIESGNIPAAYILAKNPTKQNLQEPFQASYVNNRTGKETVKLLPTKNPHVYSKNGIRTKTADAIITIGDVEYYATMKLITGQGGAQDNQRSDAQKFITLASELADKPVIALIDDTDCKSSEFYLNAVKDRNKAFIFNSDSLVDYVKWNS